MSTPLVFLPGLVCDAAVWAPQIPHLGRSALVVDYGVTADIGAMAELALAMAPPGRFALAGHSMGGRVALEVVRRAPGRVDRLALLDTGASPLPEGEAAENERRFRMNLLALARREGMRTMAAEWARGMVHPSRIGGPVFEAVLDMFERHSADVFEAQLKALLGRPDARPVLAQVACPTLVLTGENDDWSPPAAHRQMQQAVAGATLVVVPQAGHMTTIEAPEAVTAALAGWLAA